MLLQKARTPNHLEQQQQQYSKETTESSLAVNYMAVGGKGEVSRLQVCLFLVNQPQKVSSFVAGK